MSPETEVNTSQRTDPAMKGVPRKLDMSGAAHSTVEARPDPAPVVKPGVATSPSDAQHPLAKPGVDTPPLETEPDTPGIDMPPSADEPAGNDESLALRESSDNPQGNDEPLALPPPESGQDVPHLQVTYKTLIMQMA